MTWTSADERAYQLLRGKWGPSPDDCTEDEWRDALSKTMLFAHMRLSYEMQDAEEALRAAVDRSRTGRLMVRVSRWIDRVREAMK